jgi:hypothetical protein
MFRTIWLSFIGLICIAALIAVKASIGSRTAKAEAQVDATNADREPLAKADKLDVSYGAKVPDKMAVSTVKIVPTKSQAAPLEKATGITTWHWHEGSKITKR